MTTNHLKLDRNEIILEISREHIVLLMAKLMVWVLIAATPLVISVFLNPHFAGLDPRAQFAWMLIRDTYLLCAVLGLFVIVLIHYLNVHLVTNKRVIDIDQIAITSHHAVEIPVEHVLAVTAEVSGAAGSVFNYGNVTIQSAGEGTRVIFEKVSRPKEIKRAILDAVYKATGKNLS